MSISTLVNPPSPDGYIDANTYQRYANEYEYWLAQEKARRKHLEAEYSRNMMYGCATNNAGRYGFIEAGSLSTASPTATPQPPRNDPLAFMNSVNTKLLLTGEPK